MLWRDWQELWGQGRHRMSQTTSSRHCTLVYCHWVCRSGDWAILASNLWFGTCLFLWFVQQVQAIKVKALKTLKGDLIHQVPELILISVTKKYILKTLILKPYFRTTKVESSWWGLKVGVGREITRHGWRWLGSSCHTSIGETDEINFLPVFWNAMQTFPRMMRDCPLLQLYILVSEWKRTTRWWYIVISLGAPMAVNEVKLAWAWSRRWWRHHWKWNVDKSLSVGKVSFCREKKREMKYFETVYISNKYMFSPLEKANYK